MLFKLTIVLYSTVSFYNPHFQSDLFSHRLLTLLPSAVCYNTVAITPQPVRPTLQAACAAYVQQWHVQFSTRRDGALLRRPHRPRRLSRLPRPYPSRSVLIPTPATLPPCGLWPLWQLIGSVSVLLWPAWRISRSPEQRLPKTPPRD